MSSSEVFCDAERFSYHHPSLQSCSPIGRLLEVVVHLQEGAPPWPDSPASEAPQPPVGVKLTLRRSPGHQLGFRYCFLEIMLLLTSFWRSSLPPTWTLLKKIWGTVLRPASSFTLARSSGCLPISTSHTGTAKRPRVALACTQCGQPWMEYTVTRPKGLLSNSPICNNTKKTENRTDEVGGICVSFTQYSI